MTQRLFVCYVPGLDRRRLDPAVTPNVCALLADRPSVVLDTLPSTELLPTMITGVCPGEHGIWQVSHNDAAPARHWLDALPDGLTRAGQCMANFLRPKMELAAVPLSRRRRFHLHRFKYSRRADPAHAAACLARFNGYDSVFGVLGEGGSRYHFGKCFQDLAGRVPQWPSGDVPLEMLEYYAFDLFSHWNLDRMDLVRPAMAETDRVIGQVRDNCRRKGVTFVLLVDHGQELITGQTDLPAALRRLGIPRAEYLYFLEVAVARFWFFTPRARAAITALLHELPHVTVVPHTQMKQYHVDFPDARHGELYAYAHHGHAFFPHDFFEPLANVYLGLTMDGQHPRITNPRHRGNHGHLPGHPAEAGYLVVADERLRPTQGRPRAHIADVAPTLLTLLGREPAPHMKGAGIFAPFDRFHQAAPRAPVDSLVRSATR